MSFLSGVFNKKQAPIPILEAPPPPEDQLVQVDDLLTPPPNTISADDMSYGESKNTEQSIFSTSHVDDHEQWKPPKQESKPLGPKPGTQNMTEYVSKPPVTTKTLEPPIQKKPNLTISKNVQATPKTSPIKQNVMPTQKPIPPPSWSSPELEEDLFEETKPVPDWQQLDTAPSEDPFDRLPSVPTTDKVVEKITESTEEPMTSIHLPFVDVNSYLTILSSFEEIDNFVERLNNENNEALGLHDSEQVKLEQMLTLLDNVRDGCLSLDETIATAER